MSSLLRLPWVLPAAILLLQGCLSTWIRMEDGTILQPGKSDFSLAVGSVPRPAYVCEEAGWESPDRDSNGVYQCEKYIYSGQSSPSSNWIRTPAKLVEEREPHLALHWRLGALGPFGPFVGLEVGMQTEFLTAPVSQEFNVALGLPGSDSVVAHAVMVGWGIGMWADNSWFAQYAASREAGRLRVFGSARSTLQASVNQSDIGSGRFNHSRHWDFQVAAGVKYRLGEVFLLPDWVGLGGTVDLGNLGYPSLDFDQLEQQSGIGFAWAVAAGWGW
jgi:hypothetical protein